MRQKELLEWMVAPPQDSCGLSKLPIELHPVPLVEPIPGLQDLKAAVR